MEKMQADFMGLCEQNLAKPTELDDYIEYWHGEPGIEEPLHLWLGMSDDEFEAWVTQEKTIYAILERRKDPGYLGKLRCLIEKARIAAIKWAPK